MASIHRIGRDLSHILRTPAGIGVLVGVALLVMASCGGGQKEEAQPTARPAETGKMELSGEIAVAGSSTVFPISEAVAEEFSKLHPNVRVNVASTGTGAGFRAFCANDTQVSDASRPVKQKELDSCDEQGIQMIELPVAFDALSVVINPDNDWAQCLSVEELATIFGPEAQGKISNWNQVNPSFPDVSLRLYGPTTASGTFDYFTEAIMGESGAHRGDMDLATEDDPLIAQGVNGTRGGAGYFGLAYYQQYQSLVNAAAIRNPGTGQCVEPSAASVADGTYLPLARPILIYVQAGLLDTSPELKAFIDFYLDEAPKLVPEVGYVALPEAAYDWGRDRVNGRVTGSVFKDVPPGTPLDAALSRVQ